MSDFRPELLAPAGSLEKLKVAVLYGCDAVYLGGQRFGLRVAAENFTDEQLVEGVKFAHDRGTKVYVVLNGFLYDEDLRTLPEFLTFLEQQKVDAVIVSDLGVVKTVKKHCQIPIHLSTQASCLNVPAAHFWKKMGVDRIVLARELSIADAALIKKEVGIEVEMFVHGSMCMAYSGNCVISNYTQGRDSNRGGCAHSCRFEYQLDFSKTANKGVEVKNKFFMSSKDLSGIKSLPLFFEGKIDSLKVEGRMKSSHYAGTISKVYAEALDFFEENVEVPKEKMRQWTEELGKVSHRDYTEANLVIEANEDSIYNKREQDEPLYQVVGNIIEVREEQFALLQVKAPFQTRDQLEYVPFKGVSKPFAVKEIIGALGAVIEQTKPGTLVRIPFIKGMEKYNLVRRRCF